MEMVVNKTKLDEILSMHKLWLNGEGEGARADLNGANLRYADLRDAVLSNASLRGAILRGADLGGALLNGADLRNADLRDADLTGTILSDAILIGARLDGVILSNASLRGADLSGAGLTDTAYYSISWSDHGERGRRLHAVERAGVGLVFSCGCFSGLESDLREYIEVGNASRRQSRLRALEIILELHRGD